MFSRFDCRNHTIIKPTVKKLTNLIVLNNKRILLFFDQGQYCEYSLSNGVMLKEGKLPQSPYKIIAISEEHIIFTLQNGYKIMELNQINQILNEVGQINFTTGSQKQIQEQFYQCQLYAFKKSFFLKYYSHKMRTLNYNYYVLNQHNKWTKLSRSIDSSFLVDDLFDDCSKIVVYKQTIEQQNQMKFKVYDLFDKKQDKQYLVHSQSFSLHKVIRLIRMIDQHTYCIFVNGKGSQYLILRETEVQKVVIKNTVFMNSIIFNISNDFGVFLYFSMGMNYSLELMQLHSGKRIAISELPCDKFQASPQGNYFVTYQNERQQSGILKLTSHHIIKKPTFYLSFLQQLNLLQSYSDELLKQLLSVIE